MFLISQDTIVSIFPVFKLFAVSCVIACTSISFVEFFAITVIVPGVNVIELAKILKPNDDFWFDLILTYCGDIDNFGDIIILLK